MIKLRILHFGGLSGHSLITRIQVTEGVFCNARGHGSIGELDGDMRRSQLTLEVLKTAERTMSQAGW